MADSQYYLDGALVAAYSPPVVARAGYRPYRVSSLAATEAGWFYRLPMSELRRRVGARRQAQLANTRLARVS